MLLVCAMSITKEQINDSYGRGFISIAVIINKFYPNLHVLTSGEEEGAGSSLGLKFFNFRHI